MTFLYFIISCIQHLVWKARSVLFHLKIHAWWVWQIKSIKGIVENWCFELFILSFPNLMSHSIYFPKEIERWLNYSPWMGKISSTKGIVNSVEKSVTKANDWREKQNEMKLETPHIFLPVRSLYQTTMKELDSTDADVFLSMLFERYCFNHIQDRSLNI